MNIESPEVVAMLADDPKAEMIKGAVKRMGPKEAEDYLTGLLARSKRQTKRNDGQPIVPPPTPTQHNAPFNKRLESEN